MQHSRSSRRCVSNNNRPNNNNDDDDDNNNNNSQVQSCLDSPYRVASFLAASARHSGDWLFALPIASCGLKLDNEAVRVAVGLRL